jgi:hypothetical protein
VLAVVLDEPHQRVERRLAVLLGDAGRDRREARFELGKDLRLAREVGRRQLVGGAVGLGARQDAFDIAVPERDMTELVGEGADVV